MWCSIPQLLGFLIVAIKNLFGGVGGYDTIPFVVTKEVFYVAGLHHWSEGIALPFDRVTVEVVANTVADAVKSMIED